MEIKDLLIKAILGTLSSEESEELRLWREADVANEQLYRRLVDTGFLQREYSRRRSADVARPLVDMQTRIGAVAHRRQLRWWRIAAVVAAVVALGSLAFTYNLTREVSPSAGIQCGTMRASLQLVGGTSGADAPVVDLTCDEASGPSATTAQLLARYRADARRPTLSAPGDVESSAAQSLSLITPRGGEFRVTLEDGTEVFLNAQSQLIYPETFDAAERRVSVRGEAYFRVARDEHKPFIVEVDGQAVRVLGTEFNIHSYAEDDVVATTLVSGSIALQPIGAGDAQLLLTPGHQAVFSKEAHDIQVVAVDTDVATSWKDGKFVFENQTLEQIMITLARWYDFTYDFADRRAAQTVFMGRIPRYADFADVVRILSSSGGLHFDVSGKHVSVASR